MKKTIITIASMLTLFTGYSTIWSFEAQGFAKINSIIAKPQLGMVDKKILDWELKNPDLPAEIREQIMTRLRMDTQVRESNSPVTPHFTGDQFAKLHAILAKPESELGDVDRRILDWELKNPDLPAEIRAQIETKLGMTPSGAFPTALPVRSQAAGVRWVQENGAWKRLAE